MLLRSLQLAATAALLSTCAFAQTDSRAAEIERLRIEKGKALSPEVPGAAERKLLRVQQSPGIRGIFTRGRAGFKLGFGGMNAAASGFAIGPDWKRTGMWRERIDAGATIRGSTNRSYIGIISLDAPDLLDGYAFVEFRAGHRNYSQLPFYGLGPDSRKTGRSAYRLEDTTFELRPGLRPVRGLRVGLSGAWYNANVGRGDTDVYISADQQYSPAAAPGIDRQGAFFKTGVFAVFDRRSPGTERVSGYRYAAEWTRLSDQDYGAYSHGRLDFDVQHFLPFLNQRRIFAVHGHASLTDVRSGQTIPFYLQPNLGGPDSLRGFRPYRFTGANAMWMNAEYRWEAGAALDVVLFADGGKVFDRWEQLNVHQLEGSGGFGFRFKFRRDLALRLDTGFSHEGVQLWLRFNNPF